jgi:acyl carrier protein
MDEAGLQSIRTIVARWVKSPLALGDETPLVSGGLIDSMSLVDLILDLQASFAVTIAVGEVEPDDFDSIQRIARTVERFR